MALLTRELELIIIARDHTQSTAARVHGALTFIGAAITTMGVRWGETLAEMTQDAIDFRNTAALAFTQMFEKGDASIGDIEDAMVRVGKEVPVPFEEMGEAMFDIFSSIEATVPEAETILKRVSQAAVAGQTDVRSALIPTIAMMNAFGLGAEDIDYILDQQFTTVQRGILTYDEFVNNVGKVIPAAKASGQSIETMGATMAFLTRNGLNAAMAGTSAARAFELFANPKTIKNLEDAGVAVRDSRGEFRQINDVLADMDSIFGGLTAPERKQKFIDIFGQGRIQARRFFDIAIPNWEEFNSIVENFSSQENLGAMQEAYDVMMEQPRQKIDTLKNRWEALRLEIGQRFIPLLESKLLPLADRFFDFWDSLDPEQKDLITKWLGLGSAATILFGALTTIIGATKLIAAALGVKGLGGILAAVGIPALKFLGIAGLIAGAAYLIWKNWDDIKDFFEREIIPRFKDFVEFMRPYVEDFVNFLGEQWDSLIEWAERVWGKIWDFFQSDEFQAFVDVVVEGAQKIWDHLKNLVGPAFELAKTIIENVLTAIKTQVELVIDAIIWIWENFGDEITFIFESMINAVGPFIDALGSLLEFVNAVLQGDWSAAWQAFKDFFVNIWEGMVAAWQPIIEGWKAHISGFLEGVANIWNTVWTAIKDFFIGIWDAIVEFFSGASDEVSELWTNVWNGIKDFFTGIWDSIVEFFQNIWNSEIVTFLRDVLGIIGELIRIGAQFLWELWKEVWDRVATFFVETWEGIKRFFSPILEGIKTVAMTVWNAIKTFFKTTWDTIKGWFSGTWNTIKTTASNIWNGIKGIARTVWNAIVETIKTPVRNTMSVLASWWQTIRNVAKSWWDRAKAIASTIWNTIKDNIVNPVRDAYRGVRDWVSDIIGQVRRLWDKAREWVGKIRGVLSKINPATWFSPPITQTVAAGFKQLEGVVTGSLMQMERDARTRVGTIRRELEAYQTAQAQLAAAGRAAAQSQSTQTNNFNINSTSSPTAIADEISWRMRVGGIQ